MFLLRPSKSKDKPGASTPLASDFSDVESDASATSTVTLATASDDLSDKSLLTYTIYSLTKAALKSTPHNHRPKELAAGFCIPTRFEKLTDENLKSGKISEVDRAKVFKTVATCVLVYSDSPSPQQCRSRVKIIGGAHHERQSHEVLGSPGECSSGKFLYRGSLK